MSWAKFDDAFADHPKIAGLSDAAFRLHVTAILYAARFETDGNLPVGAVARMGPGREELLAAGLWDEVATGWAIHDYLDYNPSKADRERMRQQATERQQRWRNGVTNGVTNDTPVPVPLPHIDPLPDNPTPKRLTAQFREQMRVEFPELDEEAEYEKATNHVAYRKAIDKTRYYRNWLNNARRYRNGTRQHPKRGGDDAEDPILRRLRLDAERAGSAGGVPSMPELPLAGGTGG